MIRQIVDLRTTGPAWLQTDASRLEWEELARADRRDMAKRGVRYQVAKPHSLTLPSGQVLPSGSEVTLDMLQARDARVPAWRVLEDYVRRCIVLEADLPSTDGPQAA